mgnify:CR=1 FL=1
MSKQENKPLLKVVKPINFMFHRAEVQLGDLVNQIPVAKELFKESVRLDLHPSGPIHWHYLGLLAILQNHLHLKCVFQWPVYQMTMMGSFTSSARSHSNV